MQPAQKIFVRKITSQTTAPATRQAVQFGRAFRPFERAKNFVRDFYGLLECAALRQKTDRFQRAGDCLVIGVVLLRTAILAQNIDGIDEDVAARAAQRILNIAQRERGEQRDCFRRML